MRFHRPLLDRGPPFTAAQPLLHEFSQTSFWRGDLHEGLHRSLLRNHSCMSFHTSSGKETWMRASTAHCCALVLNELAILSSKIFPCFKDSFCSSCWLRLSSQLWCLGAATARNSCAGGQPSLTPSGWLTQGPINLRGPLRVPSDLCHLRGSFCKAAEGQWKSCEAAC